MEAVVVVSACVSALTAVLAAWAAWGSARAERIAQEAARESLLRYRELIDELGGGVYEVEREARATRLDQLGKSFSVVEDLMVYGSRSFFLFWLTAWRWTGEMLINRKCSLISLILPAPQRARYVEEWKDEWMAMRRGDIPKQRLHALRLVRGAVVQAYEERTEVRKQVD